MYANTLARALALNDSQSSPIRFSFSLHGTHGEMQAVELGVSNAEHATFSDVSP